MRVEFDHITSHQSSREGARIHGLVLHTTEGFDHPSGKPPEDLVQLGEVFDNEEASAHYGVDDIGKFARYVEDSQKAWAVCNFNSVTLSLEQIGFAHFTREEWFRRHAQLKGASEFLVYGHIHYGVPLRKGKVSGGGLVSDGVFQHSDLGLSGCGHTDCGPGYPEHYVLLQARWFIAHKLHPTAQFTERLRREVNQIRKHYGITEIGKG
jgi:hypothetical protein